jgi:hypothetical protein
MDARGLVFSAIAMRENSDLAEIIGAADYLNRTMLTPSEFESSIQALLGAKLIEETEPVRDLCAVSRARTGVASRGPEGGEARQ